MDTLVVFARDPQTTDAIGMALAHVVEPGDVIALQGDLGAGKSALARAIIRARFADPDMEVPSPSFALVQPYGAIVHADLYRLADESEIAELGLLEDDQAITLVEWPDRAPQIFAHKGLTIAIAIPQDGEGRVLTITPRAGRDLLAIRAVLDRYRQRG